MLRFDLPQVWSNAVRADALFTFACCLLALLVSPYFLLVPAVLGAVRGFVGHHRCPVHGLWSNLLVARELGGKKENVGAKMFAAKILFLAGTIALILFALGNPLWKLPTAILVVFSFLEWAFSFCAGCWAYALWYRRFPPSAQ